MNLKFWEIAVIFGLALIGATIPIFLVIRFAAEPIVMIPLSVLFFVFVVRVVLEVWGTK